jgi:hypothetical protein
MPSWGRHKSTIVVALAVVGLLVLVDVPGRVDDWSPGAFSKFEHGWPLTYLRQRTQQSPFATVAFASRREAQSKLPMAGIPWCSLANWEVWEAQTFEGVTYRTLDQRALVLDCLLGLVLLVAVVGGYEFRRRRRAHLLSFSLVDVFVVITATCAASGWVALLKQEASRETAIIAKLDESKTPIADGDVCVAPLWIKSLAGEKWMPDFTWRTGSVAVAALDVEDVDQLCAEIRDLPYLSKLTISGFLPGDHFPFATLASIRQLEKLQIDTTPQINDRDIRELSELRGLKKIVVRQGIAPERLSRLESALPGCKVVDPDEDW